MLTSLILNGNWGLLIRSQVQHHKSSGLASVDAAVTVSVFGCKLTIAFALYHEVLQDRMVRGERGDEGAGDCVMTVHQAQPARRGIAPSNHSPRPQ